MPLQYPDGYFEPKNCTCGPDSLIHHFIPDHLWGLSIKEACCIHDWQYEMGGSEEDRILSDRLFISNLLILINEGSANWIMRYLRRRKAYGYFEAVKRFGPVFWPKKKKPLQEISENFVQDLSVNKIAQIKL